MISFGHRIGMGATWLVTWAGRVLALIGAYEQLIVHGSNPSGVALAFCGCLLAGVETFRLVALRITDRVFDALGSPAERERPPPPPSSTSGRASNGE